MSLVLDRGGTQLDHIALAVPDTEKGVAFVRELTGVEPALTRRDPKDFYWSAAIPLAERSFLEIIGPNPDHRGVHPLKSFMAGLAQPKLLFWYVATADISAFARQAKEAGAPLRSIVKVDPATSTNGSDYTRASIGKGYISQRPGVIEWRRRSVQQAGERQCRLSRFKLCHPKADELNALFGKLGIDIEVATGPSLIGITLVSPKGEVSIENEGYDFTLFNMLAAIFRRPFG